LPNLTSSDLARFIILRFINEALFYDVKCSKSLKTVIQKNLITYHLTIKFFRVKCLVLFCKYGSIISYCVIVWGHFCRKCVRVKLYTYTCTMLELACRYLLPHSRACPLIGSFLLGFAYCDGREGESDRNIILRCSFIGYFSPGFHIVIKWNVFYVWQWYKSERTSKQSAIWLILNGYTHLVQIR
jgi:hypothetical protein